MAKYVSFVKTEERNLLITLLSSKREDVEELQERDDWNADEKLQEVLSHQLENGWHWVTPYAGLTEAPVVTDEVDFDTHGEVTYIGRMYWFMEYEKVDPVRELLSVGSITFLGAANYEADNGIGCTESRDHKAGA